MKIPKLMTTGYSLLLTLGCGGCPLTTDAENDSPHGSPTPIDGSHESDNGDEENGDLDGQDSSDNGTNDIMEPGGEPNQNGESSGAFGLVLGRALSGPATLGEPLEILSIQALFGTIDDEIERPEHERETIGACVVGSSNENEDLIAFLRAAMQLDAGFPAVLGHDSESLELDGESGAYAATSNALQRNGFAPGQSWMMLFPGGDDLEMFTAEIKIPDRIEVSSPDLANPAFTLELTNDLVLQWSARDQADTLQVFIRTSRGGQSASILCEFEDTGRATIPRAALEKLISDATLIGIDIYRRNLGSIEATLKNGSTAMVQIIGETVTPHSFIFFDNAWPCQFVSCPEGSVCNPQTIQCE